MATTIKDKQSLIYRPGYQNSTAVQNQAANTQSIQNMTGAAQPTPSPVTYTRNSNGDWNDAPVYQNADTPEKLEANRVANSARAAAPNPYDQQVAVQTQPAQTAQPVQSQPLTMQQMQSQVGLPTASEYYANKLNSMPSFDSFAEQFLPRDNSDLFNQDALNAQNSSYADLYAKSIDNKWAQQAAQDERDRLQGIEETTKTDSLKQIEDAYKPNSDKLLWYLQQTGQFNSGNGTELAAKLRDSYESDKKKVIDNYNARADQISKTYTNTVLQIADKAQAAALQSKALLDARLTEIEKNKRASEEDKQKYKLQVYQLYQQQVSKIEDSYYSEVQAEADAKDKALQREMQMASLTGVFQGAPTFEALTKAQQLAQDQQKFERSNLESDRDYQLALDKFNYQIQQDAKKGSGSGGLTVQQSLQRAESVRKAIASGVDVTDAFALYGQGLSTAAKSALFDAVNSAPITSANQVPDGYYGPEGPETYLPDYLLKDQEKADLYKKQYGVTPPTTSSSAREELLGV